MTDAKYFVMTWDMDLQKFTPQNGVPPGPYTQWGLRQAMRKLRSMGYDADRSDSSALVSTTSPSPEPA